MRSGSGILLLLCCLTWARGYAQSKAAAPPEGVRCHAVDIELYEGGGAAGPGRSSEQVIDLRNRSQRSCTLLGPPLLVSFDEHGQRVAEPYGRNRNDSLFAEGQVRLVTLEPGEFAHFKVAMTSCNNGQDCLYFNKLEVVLPGDYVPLNIGKSAPDPMRINVSGIQPGADTRDGEWVAPIAPVGVESGELTGLSLRLEVPQHPLEGFTAHFAARNVGAVPVQLASRSCVLTEKLTNSAGTTITAQQSCGKWMGVLDRDGMLVPGAVATMDIRVAGDGSDNVRERMCRTGRWAAELEIVTDVGRVRFDQMPFDVRVAQCSDSDEIEVAGSEAIHWAPIPQHGVRLGMLVRAKGDSEPAWGRYFTGAEEPTVQVGDRIVLRLFLDNMTDEPVRLKVGPGTFRLQVTRVGQNVQPDLIAPTRDQSEGPVREVTVAPHTQKELGTKVVSESYDLREGDYELEVGPLGPIGAKVEAMTPVADQRLSENAGTVKSLIKVVP